MDYRTELQVAERAARAAGAILAAHYARPEIAVETKPDNSPVTQADRDANVAVVDMLRAAFPRDAIVSEEAPDDRTRLGQRRVWLVDPLDGTRDFVARTGEFSVHVGFAVDGEPVAGAVYLPVSASLFVASKGEGAWRVVGGPAGETRARLRVSKTATVSEVRVGVSRMNTSRRLTHALATAGMGRLMVPMGASVKHMALAGGDLDAVINLSSGEQEWDTCAPEIVIREAGGTFSDGDGRPFRYNQPDLAHHRGSIASNGVCHPALVAVVASELDAS